ncbi:DUF5666 domain-containing protein, partial [bacterium]|nr:DUF5666 domain-containing protein [bacterium]
VEVLAGDMQILVAPENWENDNVLVQVTPQTLIENREGPITFADLAAGQFVMIHGEMTQGFFLAHYIFVDDGSQPPPPGQLAGTIVEVLAGDMQILVAPENWENDYVLVQVTPQTVIENREGPITFADLAAGQFVMIHGEVVQNLLIAHHIFVDDGSQPPPPQGEIFGTIVEVLAGDMQILVAPENWENDSVLVQVSPQTVIENREGPITFADLAAGQLVMIHGEMTPDLFLAHYIFVDDGSQPPPGTEFFGEIGSINYTALTFDLNLNQGHHGYIVVQATENTVIFDSSYQEITFDDLQNGMFTSVIGEMNGDILIAEEILILG